ncbi:c-type cytochrome [Glaciecola siphonariae]|uniref:C-type cytochrome n=1 Tax=Glaciecola siphonariae TaxID=521012 RepID=A0ABV9LTV2_9ALTE
MKKLISLFALCSILASTAAISQTVETEKQAKATVQFRQAILQLVRSNMGPLGAMAKGNIPYNEQVMIKNSQRIEQLGLMMEDYFAPDTRAFNVETGSKDSIWENQADFYQKAQNMVEAAAAVQKVAIAGDSDDYRKTIGALGATCKACHDDYKKD